jgi:tetratricopeptide (TPR) repeat protein
MQSNVAATALGLNAAPSAPPPDDAPPAMPILDNVPNDGVPPSYLRHIVDSNGGEAAFEGMTTSDVKRCIIAPQTEATQLSLCAQMRQQGVMCAQPATWFVSHPWQIEFLDLVRALEVFFADKPNAVIWIDLISTSQHATQDLPPEWWQQTFVSAIGQIGHMVMVMTPWDNPICLTRAWCLYELYACRSCHGSFAVAFPPSERAQFLSKIAESGDAYFHMLSNVNTAQSKCSRESDKQRIFAAVRALEGGFAGLDRGVLNTMVEWLQLQLEERALQATCDGLELDACKAQHALAVLFEKQTQFERAHALFERCFATRLVALGASHPDTLISMDALADSHANRLDCERAMQLAEGCLATSTQVLGDMHPHTLQSMCTVARICFKQKQLQRARAMHEQCAAKRRTAFGENHPKTIVSMANLAIVCQETGDLSCALDLYSECCLHSRSVNGDQHPHTLTFISCLASCYRALAQHERALELFEECYAGECRVLGEEHENSIVTLFNMANLLAETKSLNRALQLFQKCLRYSQNALGQGHATTKKCRDCIQRCQMQLSFSQLSLADRSVSSLFS